MIKREELENISRGTIPGTMLKSMSNKLAKLAGKHIIEPPPSQTEEKTITVQTNVEPQIQQNGRAEKKIPTGGVDLMESKV
jgi:hypothetical protein